MAVNPGLVSLLDGMRQGALRHFQIEVDRLTRFLPAELGSLFEQSLERLEG